MEEEERSYIRRNKKYTVVADKEMHTGSWGKEELPSGKHESSLSFDSRGKKERMENKNMED